MSVTFGPSSLLRWAAVFAALAFVTPARAGRRYSSLKELPELVDAQALLQELVNERAHVTLNHFCIIGEKIGRYEMADVFWTEENKVILWEPKIPGEMNKLILSRRYLDLKNDVVEDTGTSTYLLRRSSVEEEIKACAREGDHFVIQKSDYGR